MSLELSGTTGVKGVAGSVSAPSIVGDDTNTGISFPAADTIKFSTGGVERVLMSDNSFPRIIQVQKVISTLQKSTTSTSFVTTGISLDITPKNANSQIFITTTNAAYNDANTAHTYFTIYRDSTNLGSSSNGLSLMSAGSSSASARWNPFTITYLDHPNTTSQVTYALYWKIGSQGGTSFISYANSMPLPFVLFEVAG